MFGLYKIYTFEIKIMLQIIDIDKQTEEFICYIVDKAGGKVINKKSSINSLRITKNFSLKSTKKISDELNLPNNYSKEQIEDINKRWKIIEKSYRDAKKENY